MKMQTTLKDLDAIPDKYLDIIAHYLMGLGNLSKEEDLSKPQLRPSVISIYPYFIILYAVLIITGIVANIAMVFHIIWYKLYHDPTYAYLINIAISDMVKCIFVLPFTLAVLLVQNWIFGKFLCFFLPMMQDIPIHVSMMTHFLIAGDRYRLLRDPRKPRIPAFVCALGAWFFAVCIVLPYPIYTTYLDLGTYKKEHFHGLGLCFGNVIDDIQQYMRGLFLITYIAPLTITAYIYVKAGRELQNQEEPFPVTMFETRTKASSTRHNSDTSNNVTFVFTLIIVMCSISRSFRDGKQQSESFGTTTGTMGVSGLATAYDLYDKELDIRKEKRNQKYLIFMVSVFAILLCPLMVLRLAKLSLVETYENSGHFDITYTMFVWLGFASTATTPILYASWQMSRPTKARLKSYFQSSGRRLTLACEAGVRRSSRHVHGHVGGANVAYTQHGHADSVSGSNDDGKDSLQGNLSLASPDLLVTATAHTGSNFDLV